MKSGVKISGLDEVASIMTEIAPREANNLMRSTVHAAAGEIAKDAKRFMPADTGRMKAATKTVRRKVRGGVFRSDIVVRDLAFYWRFREYGQGPDMREDAMFMKAIALFRKELNAHFASLFGKKLEARLARLRKR